MQLPNAVKKAAEKSEALQKQLQDGKPQEQKGQDGTTPQDDGTPQDQNRDTSPPQVDQSTPDKTDTPKTDDPESLSQEEESFKQKYLTLQGKFNAQVPSLQQEVRNLQQSVSTLQSENAQLKESIEQKSQDPVGEKNMSDLDPEVFKEYGEDFGALVETIQSVQKENTNLKAKLNELSGDVNQSKVSAYDAYIVQVKAELAKLTDVSFDVLNSDQEFLNFLRQFPENEFEARFTKLHRAEAARDINSTMAIFKEYLGMQKTKQPEPKKDPEPQDVPNLQPAPNNTGTDLSPPTPQQNQKVWNRQEIAQFYKDKTNGVYRGREEEAAALEQDIFLAQQQGRIAA